MSDINFCNTKEQLNHLGEVVTGKVNGSPTGADIETSKLTYTGQVRKTLPALELEYEQSIAQKEVEADSAIDAYRLTNKGDYAEGIELENKFEFITYNGESYFATSPPYTTTATTPDIDSNLFVGGYLTSVSNQDYGTTQSGVEVKHRRGTNSEILSGIPAIAEIWFNTTDGSIHVGDGAKPGGNKNVSVSNGNKTYIAVFKNDTFGTAIENMIAGRVEGAVTVTHTIDNVYSASGSLFKFNGGINGSIDDFDLIGNLSPISFGADPSGLTDSSKAFQDSIDTGLPVFFTGKFLIETPITIKSGTFISGSGWGASELLFDIPPGSSCIECDSSGVYDATLSNFRIRGKTDSSFFNTCLDARYLRYSKVFGVDMLYCATSMSISESWGVKFYGCRFQSSGFSAVQPGTKGIDMPYDSGVSQNVANIGSFIACHIAANDVGVNVRSAGRDVVFTQCTLEANGDGVLFSGQGLCQNFIFEKGYIEANTRNNFKHDTTSFNRGDSIVIRNNFVTLYTCEAGLLQIEGSTNSRCSIVIENNTFENTGTLPTSGLIVNINGSTTNRNISYQSRIALPSGVEHWDKNDIDFRTFSSNIPIKLDYGINAVTGNPFEPINPANDLKVYVNNGVATLSGTVQDTTNTFGSYISSIATMPSTLAPNVSPYPLTGYQIANASSPSVDANFMVNGAGIRGTFPSVNAPVFLSGSWSLSFGDYD